MNNMIKGSIKSIAIQCFIGVLACISCSEDMVYHRGTPIQLAARNEAVVTRAGTDDDVQNTNFIGGEKIYAYIISDGGKGPTTIGTTPQPFVAEAAADGMNMLKLESGESLYYPTGDDVSVSVQAIYPSAAPVENQDKTFSVKTNQTTSANYMESDLMYAMKQNHERNNGVISLQFSHLMSRIIINAMGKYSVRIKQITLKEVQTDIGFIPAYSNDPEDLLGSLSGAKQNITVAVADKTDTGDYPRNLTGAVLIPPQTIKGAFVFVEVEKTVDGEKVSGTAKFHITDVDGKTFESGRQYIVNLNIAETNTDVEKAIEGWGEEGAVTVAAAGSTGFAFANVGDFDGAKDIGPYTYNGSTFTPTSEDGLFVLDSGDAIEENSDYILEYYNNRNQGTALVVAIGQGNNYQGFMSVKSFTINRADFPHVFKNSTIEVEYSANGTVVNPLMLGTAEYYPLEHPEDGVFTFQSSDNSVATVTGDGVVSVKGIGTTTISVSVDGSGNYNNSRTASYVLTVNKRTVTVDDPTFTVEFAETYSYVYDGQEKRPDVIVKDGNVTLSQDYDYTLTWDSNIHAGTNTAKAIVTGIGKYDLQRVLPFSIAQYQGTEVTMTEATKTLDIGEATALSKTFQRAGVYSSTLGASQSYQCTASCNLSEATVCYKSSDTNIAVVDAFGKVTCKAVGGPVTITAYIDETTDYVGATSSQSVKITVEKMTYYYPYVSKAKTDATPSYTVSLPATAYYTFEVVGGVGGSDHNTGGSGGIVIAKSNNKLNKDDKIYIYVGGGAVCANANAGGWNGGGGAGPGGASGGGGGGSDIRIGGTAVDNRVLVAGGGGGASNDKSPGKDGGAIGSGNSGVLWQGQTKGSGDGGGGGGGYYGGTCGADSAAGAYGGSNYIGSGWTELFNGVSNNVNTNSINHSATVPQPSGWVIMHYEYE